MPDWYEQSASPPPRARTGRDQAPPRRPPTPPPDRRWVDDDLADPSELSGWRRGPVSPPDDAAPAEAPPPDRPRRRRFTAPGRARGADPQTEAPPAATGRHDQVAPPAPPAGPPVGRQTARSAGASTMAAPLAPEVPGRRLEAPDGSRPGDERARPPKAALGPRPELPFVPGFAGLRALALLAVLAFHQGFEFARGGFLGISSFFTLSGFLVTTIALAEWARNGSFGLARFWQHRAQRLVPAFAVTMLAVVVLQATLRVGAGPEYRGDVLAALGQVLNWRYAFEGAGFTRIVAGSPVQHLWAISILTQLTLVLALLFVGLMRLTGRRWRGAGGAFALLAIASFAAAWFAAGRDGNDGMAYFGTHTRAGEALVGVVLAYAVLSPRVRRIVGSPTGTATLRYGTPIALVALAWLWVSTGLYSPGLFGGILLANALLTAWIVFAVTLPGPTTTVLGSVPLRVLGGISYAAFLVHWPLYLLLDQDRIGLDGVPLFVVRLAATLAAGAALTYAVERPFRARLHLRPAGLAVACVAVLAVLAGAAIALPELPPRGVSLTIDDGTGPGDLDVVVPSGDESLSIALVGGSLAGSLPPGFETWNADNADQQVRLATHVAADCPLTGAGPVDLAGRTVGDDVDCIGFGPRLPRLLDGADADVVLVVPSDADLGERAIDNEQVHLGDDAYDTWAEHQLESLASTLARTGAPVVWATVPHVHLEPGGDIDGDWTDVPANDPARVDRLNDIVRSVAAAGGQEVVDLAAWAQRLPRGEFGTGQRADGRDLTEDGATRAAEWLVPQLADVTSSGGTGGDGATDESDPES